MMKHIIIFLLYFQTIFAQDYSKVDATVAKYPKSFPGVDELADRIIQDFTKEDEKARAIYTWMAHNISYDNERYLEKIRNKIKTTTLSEAEVAEKTLLDKKGLCAGYSKLYKVVAEKAGLEVVYILGFTKTELSDIGNLPKEPSHAWNAVKIAGEWKLLDVTWGAVSSPTDKENFNTYFFTKPEKLFLNHFPEDVKWLFVKKTMKEFMALPIYHSLKYEIISPGKNVFKASTTPSIEYLIKNVKQGDTITYSFETDKYSNKVAHTTEGDKAKFTIPMKVMPGKKLTIFINREALATFRIYP